MPRSDTPNPRPDATPGLAGGDLSRPALRLLAALGPAGASTRPDPVRDDVLFVASPSAGVSLGRGSHRLAALQELRARDLVEAGANGRWAISETGRASLRRHRAGAGGDPFGAQHRDLAARTVAGEDGPERVTVNVGESPLDWLRRRRGPDGVPLIDAAAHEAGERLRRDLTVGGMLPSVTARWDGAVASGGPGVRDPAGATDAMIAARQRVRQALDRLGPAFADLLVDLCGFLKGLETIERERRWPARSGKVVVRLALDQLARHYGLASEAHGPARSRGIRVWAEAEEA